MTQSFLFRLIKLFFNQRGEAGAAGDPGGAGGAGDGGTPWYQSAESLKTSDPEIWSSLEKRSEKDLPSFVKSAVSLERKLGTSIVPPGKDAKPEEIAAFRQKIYGTGVFKAPPESADKYEITRPEAVPEHAWSDDLVKGFRAIAHKHGLSQDAVKDLIDFEANRFANMKSVIEYDRAKSEGIIKTKAEQEGLGINEVMAYGGAWLVKHVGEQGIAKLQASGLANDPELAWMIAKAGRDSGEDISIVQGRSDPEADAEYNEVKKFMSDPNHADYKRWKNGDTAIMARIEAAYRKKFGTGEAVEQGGET